MNPRAFAEDEQSKSSIRLQKWRVRPDRRSGHEGQGTLRFRLQNYGDGPVKMTEASVAPNQWHSFRVTLYSGETKSWWCSIPSFASPPTEIAFRTAEGEVRLKLASETEDRGDWQ